MTPRRQRERVRDVRRRCKFCAKIELLEVTRRRSHKEIRLKTKVTSALGSRRRRPEGGSGGKGGGRFMRKFWREDGTFDVPESVAAAKLTEEPLEGNPGEAAAPAQKLG